jgi:hypothetical protein
MNQNAISTFAKEKFALVVHVRQTKHANDATTWGNSQRITINHCHGQREGTKLIQL